MRLYLEAMEEILMNVDDKIVIDHSIKGMLPLLQLNAGPSATAAGGQQRRTGGGR